MTPTGSRLHVASLLRPWAERLLADYLRPAAGAVCVDLPCGDGALSVAMARSAARVIALDTDAAAVAACRSAVATLGLANVEALQIDASSWVPNAGATVAGSVLTLADRSNPGAVLAAAVQTVRPGGRLAAAVWASPGAVPPIDALLAAFSGVGAQRPAALEAALSLGAPGALESLSAAAGIGDPRVDRVRDVARFEGVEHLVAALSSAYGLEPHLDALDEAAFAALLEILAQRLLPWTAPDGTLVVPVEAAVLYAAIGVE